MHTQTQPHLQFVLPQHLEQWPYLLMPSAQGYYQPSIPSQGYQSDSLESQYTSQQHVMDGPLLCYQSMSATPLPPQLLRSPMKYDLDLHKLPAPLKLIDYSSDLAQLAYFLQTVSTNWQSHESIRRFLLPTGEYIACVLHRNIFYISGTDIVRMLVFRFQAINRSVRNAKKFEEGVFSNLRNLKVPNDATLELARSEFLEWLYKHNCIRTQKKQKVFFWFSVLWDRLFFDALNRDIQKEVRGEEPTTVSIEGSEIYQSPNAPGMQPLVPAFKTSRANYKKNLLVTTSTNNFAINDIMITPGSRGPASSIPLMIPHNTTLSQLMAFDLPHTHSLSCAITSPNPNIHLRSILALPYLNNSTTAIPTLRSQLHSSGPITPLPSLSFLSMKGVHRAPTRFRLSKDTLTDNYSLSPDYSNSSSFPYS